MRCPASLRLSIASSRTVSSSAMRKVYGRATCSDHPIVSPSPASACAPRLHKRLGVRLGYIDEHGEERSLLRLPPLRREAIASSPIAHAATTIGAGLSGSGPSVCPAPMPQGVSYVTSETSSPACYPEPEGQSHLKMVRHVSEFKGLGRQCSWKEGWK
jgi:hypothetical protein